MFNLRAKMITVGLLGAAAIVPVDFARADQLGHASWYSLPANKTANGEQMNPNELTAAHRSLPFGTRVLVENLSNGRTVVVRINDRGPFIGGRIIDLSKAAAASIGMIAAGTAKVRVTTADGGVLAALGESTAKAKDDGSRITAGASAATPEGVAAIVSAKMTGATDTELKKEAKAKPSIQAKIKPSIQTKAAAKPSIQAKAETKASGKANQAKAKVAAKTAKAKTLVAAKSPATKKRAGSQTIRVAAVKRSKPSGGAEARVQMVAAVKRSKPSGSAKARVQVVAAANGIRAASREASTLSSQRMIVASNGLRAAGREASKLSSRRVTLASAHPYAVLGNTPGFMKPARTRDRRATG